MSTVDSITVTSVSTVNQIEITSTSGITVTTVGTQGLAGPSSIMGRAIDQNTAGATNNGAVLIYDNANTTWTASDTTAAQALTQKIYNLQLNGGGTTVNTILDEDNMASNSATALATQQSIKTYVDAQVTLQDLDITDGTTTIAIDLDSETLGLLGGVGISSTASGNNVSFAIDATVVTLTGTQTLTSKTLTSPTLTSPVLNGSLSGAAFLDEDDFSSNSATAVASQQSIKAFVESTITAEDLDITDGSSNGSIDLDSEVLGILGGTGLTSSLSGNNITLAIDNSVVTLTGSQTLTNKTLTTPVIAQISNTGILTLPTSSDTLVGRATTDTLTNKTLTSPKLNGSIAITTTGTEINVLDGDTSASPVVLVDADQFIVNDNGTMKQLAVTRLDTYFSGTTATLTNKTLTAPVINNGVLNTSVSGSAFLDEDDFSSNSATKVASQQSIKAYVDANITAQDLDVSDGSTDIAIDLDSETLSLLGGTGIDSTASGNAVTFAIDSTVATLVGSQILTNKTIDVDNNTVSNIELDNLKSGVLDTDLSSVVATDTTIASAKAIKTYVDANITAQDLDITDGSSTIAIDLDSETLSLLGGTGVTSTASGNGVTFAIGQSVGTGDDVVFNQVTGALVGNSSTATALATGRTIALAGDVVASGVSFDGTGNISLTTAIQPNSVALATDTTGNYVSGISGTANEIEVTGSGSEDATVTIGLPNNVTISGNLTVNGTTTTTDTNELHVTDPLIKLAKDNTANSLDIGFYGQYRASGSTNQFTGLFRDQNDSGKYKLFELLEAEPTTTVNTSGTGYQTATLVANLEGNVVGNLTGTLQTAAQGNITSLGTLTALQVDNININGNTISSTAGTDLNITPLAGHQIVLDGAIVIDAGVVTGATSITSTAFVGALTGNASTATTLETARTIGGVSFNGSANIDLAGVNTTGNQDTTGNAATATALATSRTIALSGDVVGSASFDGTGNATLSTTIQANSVALGTDTTGDYVESLVAGTGVTLSNNSGEGATPTVAIGQAVATSSDVTFNTVTADVIGNINGATEFTAQAGEALTKGDAVYISGISGNTPIVSKADADVSSKMPSFGLAKADANLNASVVVITFGTLSGLNTSSFSAGDILFISTTAGGLTATAPTGESSLLQNIGIVQRSHASAGSIKVGGAGRTNATPNLNNGKIFLGNGSNQSVSTTLDSSIVPENTNLYYTDARANSAIDARVTNTFINNLSGVVADTATALATARTIGGVSFDGTANINLAGVNTTGNQDTSGNAATATILETARTINGVSFDGSANITTLTAGTGVSVSGTAVSIGQAVATSDSPTFANLTLGGNDSIKVPAGTTGQRNGSPVNGMFRYNSSNAEFEGYQNGAWGAIAGGGAAAMETSNHTGDGSTRAFSVSTNVVNEDNLVCFIDGVYQNKDTFVASGTTVTFDTAPANTRKIVIYHVRSAVAGSSIVQDSFTGNGSTTDYTLSINPTSELNTQVYIDGVYQNKSTYTVSGTTLAFDTAPINTTSIEVIIMSQTAVNAPTSNSVTTSTIVDGNVTTAKILDANVTTAKIADDAVTSAKLDTNIDIAGTLDVTGATTLDSTLSVSGNITGTLATAAQPNITSVGTLTALTGGTGDLNWDSGTLFVDSSANAVGIGTTSPAYKLTVQEAIDTYAFNIRDTIGNERVLIGSRATAPIDNITPVQIANDNAGNLLLSSRTNIASGIKFYSSAGTTAIERMRIDSSGNLLVGTTSAYGTTGTTINAAGLVYSSADGDRAAQFDRTTSDGELVRFSRAGTTVGSIGTTSGYTKIVGGDGTNGSGLLFSNSKLYPVNAAGNISDNSIDIGVSNYRFKDLYLSGNITMGAISQINASTGLYIDSDIIHFRRNNEAESARIDSSGNLLVGTTDNVAHVTSSSGEGIALSAGSYGGFIGATRNQDVVMQLNRTGNDGDIVRFAKDGTTVGSISATGDDLTIGTGDTGIRFVDASDSIQPINTSTGGRRDAAVDIGVSSYRFKDGYFSGNINANSFTAIDGIYVGGNGFANKLDDYEEGTWSPQVYYQNSTDQANATNVVQDGKYIKIGKLVFLQWRLDFSQSSSSPANDNIGVKNLPFAGENNHYAGGGNVITSTTQTALNWQIPQASGTLLILTDSTNVGNFGNEFGTGSNKYMRGSVTYIAQ